LAAAVLSKPSSSVKQDSKKTAKERDAYSFDIDIEASDSEDAWKKVTEAWKRDVRRTGKKKSP
jgi:hypothetical protein